MRMVWRAVWISPVNLCNRGDGSFFRRRIVFRVDDSPFVATYLFRGDEFLQRRLFIKRENSFIKAKNLGLRRRPGKVITETIFCDRVGELNGQLP